MSNIQSKIVNNNSNTTQQVFVFIIGPLGSGKRYRAELVCKALDIDFNVQALWGGMSRARSTGQAQAKAKSLWQQGKSVVVYGGYIENVTKRKPWFKLLKDLKVSTNQIIFWQSETPDSVAFLAGARGQIGQGLGVLEVSKTQESFANYELVTEQEFVVNDINVDDAFIEKFNILDSVSDSFLCELVELVASGRIIRVCPIPPLGTSLYDQLTTCDVSDDRDDIIALIDNLYCHALDPPDESVFELPQMQNITSAEEQFVYDQLQSLDDTVKGKRICKLYLQSVAPEFVPMATVLNSDLVQNTLVPFFEEARFSGKEPKKSFAQLVAIVEACGLTQQQCIRFDEATWITPSPNNTRQPGGARHKYAVGVLMNIIKHLQRACIKCGKDINDLRADQLNTIHLDHQDTETKTTKYSPAQLTMYTPKEAFKEWIKCESTCCQCHDQGEKAGGKLRSKKRKRST